MKKVVVVASAVFAAFMHGRADMVLANNPAVAGLSVVTNAMGSSSCFPDLCTNFTVEAWVKPSAHQTRDDTYSPVFCVTTSDRTGYSRQIFGLRKKKLALFQSKNASGSSVHSEASSDIPLNTWTHVAVVHTATNLRFYVNGALDGTAEGSFLPPVTEYSNSHLSIGGFLSVIQLPPSSYPTCRVFQGSIADLRVWTTDRTAEEIASLYQNRLRGDEEDLLLYAPFDDAQGSVAIDRATGQRLIAPDTMRFVEDSTLSLAAADARLVSAPYLGSMRTGSAATGYSAIVTDVDLVNKDDGTGPDFTFEAWLRVREQYSNDQWIISKYATSGNTGWVGLDIRGNSLKPEAVVSGTRITMDNPIATGEWVHVAATRQGATCRLYLNGALKKTGTCPTTGFTADNANAPLKLLNAGKNQSFGGDLREVRVWSVARTPEEIASYYDKAATGREAGLIGCWPMSEGYGSNVCNKVTAAFQPLDKGMGFCLGAHLVTTSSTQTMATDAQLTTSDFTLEAWVRDDSPTSRDSAGNGRGYILSQFQGGKDWVSLCFNGRESLKPGLRISSNKFFESSASIEKGKWFHLAGTREGTTVKVYLNGELVNETTYNGALGVPNAKLTFFDLADSKSGHVGGIREARAWSYARSQDQIRQHMYCGVQKGDTGLVGWWPFDEGPSATKVLNRASNNLDAAVPAGAKWGRCAAPLLAEPDAAEEGEEAGYAADFGGGWFSAARTGVTVDVGDFTFETWVKPYSYPYYESYLLAQYKEGEANPGRFLMGITDTSKFGLFIGGADASGRAGGWKTTDCSIPLNRWTHLAATRQGSTLRLYVNGELDKTVENYTTNSPYSEDFPHSLTLGSVDGAYCYNSGACPRDNISRSFHGAMREVRVWSLARSADDIKATCDRRLGGKEPGLVGYWPLAQQDSTRLVNRHDGTVGYILAGWERVSLSLREPLRGFMMLIR